MEQKAFFSIRADISKNRLLVVLKGFFNEEAALQAIDKALVEIKKMRPGFSVITDISELNPANALGQDCIRRGQQAVADQGVKRIIRIVDRKHITGQMQFLRIGREVYKTVEAGIATSFKEAETMLDAKS